MLLGAAKLLKQHEQELQGSVKLLFQPAEEGGAGGKRLVKEGEQASTPLQAHQHLQELHTGRFRDSRQPAAHTGSSLVCLPFFSWWCAALHVYSPQILFPQ